MIELIKRIFNKKQKFVITSAVYILDNGEVAPTDFITDKIKWYDKLTIETFSREEAEQIAFKMLDFKYPDLAGCFWIL